MSYFPPPGNWQRKSPSEVGLDAAKLKDAIAFAQSKDSGWDFEKDQVRVFGTPLAEDAMTGVAIGMAMAGLRPIHVHIRMDFVLLAMNQLVNIA